MNLVKIGTGHSIIASKVVSVLNMDNNLNTLIPSDACAVYLCDKKDARSVVIDTNGIFYISSMREDTICKKIEQSISSISE